MPKGKDLWGYVPSGAVKVPGFVRKLHKHGFDKTPRFKKLCFSAQYHGIMDPLVVCRCGDSGYTLVDGFKRLKAAQKAGMYPVPALIAPNMLDALVYAYNINNFRGDWTVAEKNVYKRELLKEIKKEFRSLNEKEVKKMFDEVTAG